MRPSLPSLLALIFSTGVSYAQDAYELSFLERPYRAISGGSTHQPESYAFGYDAWDEGAAEVSLPFAFSWYGATYSTVWVYTNGLLSFTPPSSGANPVLAPPRRVPDPTDGRHNFLAPMWTDLTGLETSGQVIGEIRSELSGAAPTRRFTIQLSGFRAAQNPLSSANFQVVFEEDTQAARLIWGPNAGLSGGTSAVEGPVGGLGINLLATQGACGIACVCAPGACGSIHWLEGLEAVLERPQPPDLIGIVDAPPGGAPGTDFDVAITVRNVGQQDAGAFDAQIRLSADTVLDIQDTLLGTVRIEQGVVAGQQAIAQATVSLPAGTPVGRWFVGLVIDAENTVTEANEANNTPYDAGGFSTGPDLTAEIDVPMSSGPGEPLAVTVRLRADGVPEFDPVAVALFISEDAVIDQGDRFLATLHLSMPDGFALDTVESVMLPSSLAPSPPSYRVLAQIDPLDAVSELDEGNNVVLAPTTLTLSASDLEITGLDAGPFVFRDRTYPAAIEVYNAGGTEARGFAVCLILSDNPLITVLGDDIIARADNVSLPANSTTILTLEPLVPADTATGTRYLAAVADCDSQLDENNENNNTFTLEELVLVRDPAPDFTIVDVATSPDVAAGEPAAVTVVLANDGNLDSEATFRVVLADTPTPNGDDLEIWSEGMPIPLLASQEVDRTRWVDLPSSLASGQYYLVATIDPGDLVEEVQDDNNTTVRGPIVVDGADLAVVGPPPPNAAIGISYFWRFVAAGGSGRYDWSVSWQSGSTPDGIRFDDSVGELFGTPDSSALGRHPFVVTARSDAKETSRAFVLIVTPPTLPLAVLSSRLPAAIALERYELPLVAAGGVAPYRWSVNPSDDLPQGLELMPDGRLIGRTSAGAYTFTVVVEDDAEGTASAILALDVIDPTIGLSISTADIPTGVVGESYAVGFQVRGGTAPITWRVDGDEIPGMQFEPSTALLSGTPTVAARFPLIVEARDSRGLIDRNAYVFEAFPADDLVITAGEAGGGLPDGVVGNEYLDDTGAEVRFRAVRRSGSGSLADLRWTVLLGEVPPGLSLNSDSGTLTGMPTETGVFPFTVFVADATGDSDRATFVMKISESLAIGGGGGSGDCSCRSTSTSGGSWWTGLLLLLTGLAWRYRRLLPVLGLLVLFQAAPAFANDVPYEIQVTNEAYLPLGSGATLVSPQLGDGGVLQVDLPFSFFLYGEPHETIWINANGFLSVHPISQGHHFPPATNPDQAAPDGFVAPLWGDWCVGPAAPCASPSARVMDAGIYMEIDETPDAGSITIEWRGARHFADVGLATNANFQVTLHEGPSGLIDLKYGDITFGRDSVNQPTRLNARVGMEGAGGDEGRWLACSGLTTCRNEEIELLSGQRIRIVADAGPDLTGSIIDVPSLVYPGLSFEVSFRYQSRHGQALGPTTAALVLVPAGRLDAAQGTEIWSTDGLILSPFESRTIEASVMVSEAVPRGRYRVALRVDREGSLAEPDETNNTAFAAMTTRVGGLAPDFIVRSASTVRQNFEPGDTLVVDYVAANAGNLLGDLQMSAFLSTNPTLSRNDRLLGTYDLGPIEPGSVHSGSTAVALPPDLPTGPYHVGFVVDPDGLVDELSETNNATRAPDPISVVTDWLEVLTKSLPAAVLTRPYSAQVRAMGGSGAYGYRLISGEVPRGLAFDILTGEIYGVPIEPGLFVLGIEVTSGDLSAQTAVALEVHQAMPELDMVTTDLPVAVTRTPMSVRLETIGGVEPLQFRPMSPLPPGVVLGSDGTLLGEVSLPGTYTFEIRVEDRAEVQAARRYDLEVRAQTNLQLEPMTFVAARIAELYRKPLVASGGTPPYTFQALSTLPPGLIIGPDGMLTGVPEKAGRYASRVEVRDLAGAVDTGLLHLEVESDGLMRIVGNGTPEFVVSSAVSADFEANGGVAPYRWQIDSEARPGWTEDSSHNGGKFSLKGRFAVPMVWTGILKLSDSSGRTAERPIAVRVREAADSEPPPVGCHALPVRSAPVLFLFCLLFARVRRRSG